MRKLNMVYEAPECFIAEINAAQVLCQSGFVGSSSEDVEEYDFGVSIW